MAWEEGGHLPDVIVELLSPSTAAVDRNEKKEIYARSFGTKEYYLVDPGTRRIEGFGLAGRSYQPLSSTGQGRFWSDQLGVFLGFWHGLVNGREADWVRLFRPDGSMVPTTEERALAAETEVTRLRALLEGSKR